MSETVERNGRFYTKENGEILTENEQLKEWLIVANKENKRLHSIIKEVREYIEEWQKFPHTNGSTHKELKNLIDILDKGE